MKAMILAAGRGERLRPLTDEVPKPLVPAGGKPLIAWHLERLARAGCRHAVVNVSHLADRIIDAVGDGSRYGISVSYSREHQPLETAGGIAQALPLLGDAPFLVVNADIYCECDFSRLLGLSLGEHRAHLVLIPNPAHHPSGDFTLSAGRVGNTGEPRYTYAGVSVLSPALVSAVVPGRKAQLAPLLREAADRQLVSGERYDGVWHDIGTRERLAALEAWLLSRHETN
ncbi:MAG TPA: nucleotidyltransferase family protein [Burkholderiales bacterium]|nr:nucleotidyltransferase family protein [Burkholderiales bacterium]